MSEQVVEQPPDLRHAEIVDHNVAAGYVTYIVDRWEGDKDDATVGVTRYIGVWKEEQLEKDGEAIDPLFWPKNRSMYSYRNEPDAPSPLHWHTLEEVKKPDKELLKFKREQDSMLEEPRYSYGAQKKRVDLYKQFLDAIDRLVTHPEDAVAWEQVEAWRKYNARLHEK